MARLLQCMVAQAVVNLTCQYSLGVQLHCRGIAFLVPPQTHSRVLTLVIRHPATYVVRQLGSPND